MRRKNFFAFVHENFYEITGKRLITNTFMVEFYTTSGVHRPTQILAHVYMDGKPLDRLRAMVVQSDGSFDPVRNAALILWRKISRRLSAKVSAIYIR